MHAYFQAGAATWTSRCRGGATQAFGCLQSKSHNFLRRRLAPLDKSGPMLAVPHHAGALLILAATAGILLHRRNACMRAASGQGSVCAQGMEAPWRSADAGMGEELGGSSGAKCDASSIDVAVACGRTTTSTPIESDLGECALS